VQKSVWVLQCARDFQPRSQLEVAPGSLTSRISKYVALPGSPILTKCTQDLRGQIHGHNQALPGYVSLLGEPLPQGAQFRITISAFRSADRHSVWMLFDANTGFVHRSRNRGHACLFLAEADISRTIVNALSSRVMVAGLSSATCLVVIPSSHSIICSTCAAGSVGPPGTS